MRVLRILSELDFGGVEQVALNSFPELNKKTNLQVLVLKNGGRVSNKLEEQNVSIKILYTNPKIPNLRLIRLIQKEIQGFRPDVVHCQGAEANFHGVCAASFENVEKVIAEEIGIPNHHSVWRWVFRWVYSKTHRVITVSEAVKDTILKLGEVKGKKVKVVYNPISVKESEQLNRRSKLRFLEKLEEKKSFIFVTTCRLVSIKNLERLILAFTRLLRDNPKKGLKLKIVGDGPDKEKLKILCQKIEIGDYVEFLGFQSDVFPFLIDSDVFVLPSLSEGSSVSLAEAMSMSLPCIVTQVGGAKEVLGKSNSGILIDPLNIDEIISAMQQMLDLKIEERLKLGERAKEEAKRFSVENYTQELMAIYDSGGR